ncbi:MAG TPA: ABC transporter ATP-binding protein [Steroidobacteraceae bacterium]|jgi:ABC-type multidrug transport system fused ATPase/permease subunit|nr:ABC transporter ATP-binding protein [Steroidobacteraceae bacterium]
MNAPTLPNRLWPFALHFFRQFRWGCLGLLAFPVLGRAVFASIAYATKRLTDTVLAMHDPAAEAGKLVAPFTLFVVLVIARFLTDSGMWFSSYHTRAPMLVRIKEEVFAYAQRLSSAYFENTLSGKIAHRAILLPDQVLALFDMTVFDFVPGACFFVFVACYFYVASPLFCATAFAAILLYFTVSLLVGRECTRRAILNNEARAAVTGRVVDVLTNIRNVFFFANQGLEDEELKSYTGEERNRRRASYRAVVRLRCVQYVMDISMWIVFVGGALYAWVHRLIGAGDFVMITALTSSLLQTAYNLGQRIPEFYDQLGSARESIDTLIVPATIVDRPGAPELRVTRGAIRFEQVAFAYDALSKDKAERARNVVKAFALTIPAGQRVGLVGPSGAGKTTLMGLLLRMHDVVEGAIRIDEQDIREVTQQSLRRSIALIPQDTTLFHRSLLENIRYGRPGATDEEVELAARRAHAHEFIVELDRGYHTLVGERGTKLSGGQRQRIAIARAILKDAPILLLDEATSALDSHSEHIIQAAMREAMAGKTVIAIAHRLSTVMDMDRLIVLDRGRIAADGSHEELLRQGGLYAELWQRQSGGFNPVARPAELEQAVEIGDFDGQATGVIERPAALEEGEKA